MLYSELLFNGKGEFKEWFSGSLLVWEDQKFGIVRSLKIGNKVNQTRGFRIF